MHISYDDLVTEKRVLCGPCALARAGLCTYSTVLLFLETPYKEIDGICAACITYWYYPNIDYEYELTPTDNNPLILQPSKERALVEFIMYSKAADEGILIEALQNYLLWFRNDEKLYKCADHFNVPRETIDYWIREAEEDEEV
jgi:hypothetical protein